jgi:ATP/ADP translocase/HEAT repeat protein
MVLGAHKLVKQPTGALSAGALLLVIMAGHTVLETARDSLFLARMPIVQLPFTYLLIAVAALLATELHARLGKRGDHARLLSLTLLSGALGTLVFSRLFAAHVAWAPLAFYVWVAVVATLAVAQFWLLLSELLTVIEAKRLYPLVSAGGLLGAMLGGGIARMVAGRFGDVSLLVCGAGLFALAAAHAGAPAWHARAADPMLEIKLPPSDAGSSAARRDLRSERYLRRLLALTLIATIAGTLVDFLFKAEVVRTVPSDQLGRFFGGLNLALNGAALVVQFVLAPRLLGGMGVGRALPILPSALLLTAFVAVWRPSFLFTLLLRGIDGSLRNSLYRSALELLYLPLPALVRARWKTLVDALGQRGGQALGSLLILACLGSNLPARPMLGLLAALLIAWLLFATTMEARYLALFRAKIRAGSIETRAEVPALDLRALESLVAALSSDNDDEVLATIDLLIDYDRVHVIPALLLYHPSRAVVTRTLDVLASSGRSDFAGAARRLLTQDDDELRTAAMVALARQMLPSELHAELAHPLPVAARAAVLVALLARGADAEGLAAEEITRGCRPEAPAAVRMAFARAFRLQADPACFPYLPRLLLSAAGQLQVEVARVMLALPDPAHAQPLIRMLGNRRARPIARDALFAIGAAALQALIDALSQPNLPRQVRAHLPRSISRFGTEEATDILLEQLEREVDGWVRFKIIRGLGQLRMHMSEPSRMRRALRRARHNLSRAVHFTAWQLAGERDHRSEPRLRTPGGELLIAALSDKAEHAIDRAVRLVGLAHAPDIIHDIRRALAGQDRRRRADSIEVLVHDAPPDIARALSALLDDAPASERVARAAEALREETTTGSYEARLEAMLQDESEAVRSVAAYHVGELGLTRLGESFSSAAKRSSELTSDVFARVSRLLERVRIGDLQLQPSAAGPGGRQGS